MLNQVQMIRTASTKIEMVARLPAPEAMPTNAPRNAIPAPAVQTAQARLVAE